MNSCGLATGPLPEETSFSFARDLRSERDRYAALFDFAPVACFAMDLRGKIQEGNSAFCQLLGRSEKSVKNRPFFIYVDALELRNFQKHLSVVREQRSARTDWFRLRNASGASFLAKLTSTPVIFNDEVVGFCGSLYELSASDGAFQKIAEAASDAIWEWDLTTGDFKLSGKPDHLADPALKEGTSFSWKFVHIHPTDRKNVLASFETAIKKLAPEWSSEYWCQGLDGSLRFVLDHTFFVYGSDGRLVRAFGYFQDRTSAKEAETKLRQQSEEISRFDRELQQFAFVASHDLKEPLRMVTSYVQLLERLEKAKLSPQGLECIRYASEGATRMYQLIDGLLAYATCRKNAGAGPCNADFVVRDVLQALAPEIESCGAKIILQPLPEVPVSESHLFKVLFTLVGNALKYRGQKRPEIIIQARRHQAGLLFSVHDNGIGIEPVHFRRIFRMFQRLDSKNKYAGTGTGLAISQKIVRDCFHGEIWVESAPGAGSAFYFTVPVPEATSFPISA